MISKQHHKFDITLYISMTFKYKYVRRLETSEKKSREIHRYFSLDLNASLKGGVKKMLLNETTHQFG